MAKVDANAQAFVQAAIDEAEQLLAAKAEIQGKLQSSRDMLGNIAKQELCTAEQAKWIAENLPKRERGPREKSTANAE